MKFFSEIFPPPDFLNIQCSGLHISDDAVRVITIKNHKTSYHVGSYGTKIIPEGVISEGYIHKPKELQKILSEIKVEFNIDTVKVALPDEKAYSFKTSIAVSDGLNIKNSIEFHIEENVPIPAGEAIFDFSIIGGEKKLKKRKEVEVLVTATPQKAVSAYTSSLEEASITPCSLVVESQAVSKALVDRMDKSVHLIVNMLGKKVGFYLVNENKVSFASVMALQDQNDASNQNSFIYNEIEKLYSYWNDNNKSKNKNISSIIICGNLENFSELLNKISKSLDILVEEANVWKNVFSFEDQIPPISKEESFSYAAAIGLAIP